MYSREIPRWVIASLSKRLSEVATTLGIQFYSEGIDNQTSKEYQKTNLSLRVDGPIAQEGSSITDYKFDVQGIITAIGEFPGYKMHDFAGIVAKALREPITVFKYPESPTEEVGCLNLDVNATDGIRIVNLGVVNVSSNVRQISSVIRLILEV